MAYMLERRSWACAETKGDVVGSPIVDKGHEDIEGTQQTVRRVLDTIRHLVDRVPLPADDFNARERRSEPQPPVETVSCTGQYHGVARRVKRQRFWRSVRQLRTAPLLSRAPVL